MAQPRTDHRAHAHPGRSAHPPKDREDNPKASPDQTSNQIKDPNDWVSGGEPMTGAQASYLKTLSEQTHHEEAYDPELDKAEASKRIDKLKHERDD